MFSSSALSVASSTPWVTVASAVTFGLVGFPAGRPAALTADTGVSSMAVGAAAAAGWSPLTVAARCARMASALALMAARISSRLFCCSSMLSRSLMIDILLWGCVNLWWSYPRFECPAESGTRRAPEHAAFPGPRRSGEKLRQEEKCDPADFLIEVEIKRLHNQAHAFHGTRRRIAHQAVHLKHAFGYRSP